MFKLIKPEEFKTTAWKNGQGETTELTINDGGGLSDFDWRISIAIMTESGQFSTFKGYQRHLLLLKGAGLRLVHDNAPSVSLDRGEKTVFDGANHTIGELMGGPVQNFNVITNQETCIAEVSCYHGSHDFKLELNEQMFVYAVNQDVTISLKGDSVVMFENHLLQISGQVSCVSAMGHDYLVIKIIPSSYGKTFDIVKKPT